MANFVLAAKIHDQCASKGIQVGTIDAQIAAAAIHHKLELLTADQNFVRIAKLFPLKLEI